jgi:uncharacterized protein (TIGR00375 family)
MQVVADLHLHSKYSRAVSREMELRTMASWADKKGINLLATGDWTHPLWFKEIESQLVEDAPGIFKLKTDNLKHRTRFILSTEIANIYTQGGKGRRIHTVFLAPSLETADKINTELKDRGGNLISDGRPILGLDLREMCELIWSVDEDVMVIPAHIWTPWFSLFGSKSGFDSLAECFGEYQERIYAIETGLSSDPAMNWQIKELDRRAIVSSSDAHSPKKIGRELTVFQSKKTTKKMSHFSYDDIYEALAERFRGSNQGSLELAYTVEFYPEEGKYHYTGHRNCGVVQSPAETREKGAICHVCGRQLTVGVMHRVDQLADPNRKTEAIKQKVNERGVTGYYNSEDKTRPPYMMLVPLQEILAEALGVGVASQQVGAVYENLVTKLGSEFEVLMRSEMGEIEAVAGARVAEAVARVRKGEIVVKPGYDGVFGEVRIWPHPDSGAEAEAAKTEQQTLF